MKILFRLDSSSKIGIGHLMRSLVLASTFKQHKISFASRKLDGNLNHKITKSGYSLEILKSNDKKELLKLINKLNPDLVIIDSYEINHEFESYIKENTKATLMCFDDTYNKHNCDILINHNIYANKKKYKGLVPKHSKLLCGAKYILLRDEFYEELKNKKINKDNKTSRIFLAMGGSDHSNINIKILQTLKSFKNIKVELVTSSANKNLKSLQQYIKNKKHIKLHIDSKQIAKLMRKSDLAILSPSVSANEAYFMKLPFISIKTAPNQNEMCKYLKKNNYICLKSFNKKKLYNGVKNLIKRVKNA